MTFVLRTFVLASLLLAPLAFAATAAADDPCGAEAPLASLPGYEVGVWLGDGCYGVHVVRTHTGCLDVLWGVHTRLVGVGGHDTCDNRVYVGATPLLA